MVSSKFSHRTRVSYPKICKPPPPPPLIPLPPPATCTCEFDEWEPCQVEDEIDWDYEPQRADLPNGDPVDAAWAAEPPGWLEGPATVHNYQAGAATYTAPEVAGDYWVRMTLTWSDGKVCVHAGICHVTD